jgi:hypothetical protein
MSQRGYLAWYTEADDCDLIHLLKNLPKVVGFKRADSVYWTDPEETGLEEDEDSGEDYDDEDANDDDDPDFIGSEILAKELFRLFDATAGLRIAAEKAELGDRIERGVLRDIPESVRGRFIPSRPFIEIGKHYLYDGVSETVFARPNVTVGCWGYSTPKDSNEFRKRMFALPEFVEETHRLEHLIGPLKHALYLSL